MKRKFIDERGRFFGVISVIDVLVVVIVLVLGAAVYMRFFENEQTATAVSNDEFSYQVMLRNVRSMTADAIRVGDSIYDTENGTLLGVVTDIEAADAQRQLALEDGTYVMVPVENRYDVTITLDVSGLISNGRYYAARTYELSVNSDISFYTKYLSTSGVVWKIG
ncbi:MAG: DUF4330 family protein [Oscillospiraceae bacterium]